MGSTALFQSIECIFFGLGLGGIVFRRCSVRFEFIL